MCIRDREYADLENFGPVLDLVTDACLVEPAGLTAAELPSACLLYTSDAADERSSVDLGGRRIIKKKNRSIDVSRASTTLKQHNTSVE